MARENSRGLQMSVVRSTLGAFAACVAIHSGALAESALAKLSLAEVQGTAFQRPDIRKVPDGAKLHSNSTR